MMIELITPTIKDRVLNYLIQHCELERIVTDSTPIATAKELAISLKTLHAVLNHFQRRGLIKELNFRSVGAHLVLLSEAHDFYLRGGFTAQEDIFETNINKLLFEIDTLKKQLGPDHLDTINKLSSIASAVISGMALFKK